jgi:hypothetical protein
MRQRIGWRELLRTAETLFRRREAAVLKEWLTRRVTVEEAESANMVQNERLGPDPVPFGFINHRWKQLVARMAPGDELWEFSSSPESWANLAGRSGVALVRGGEVIDSIITEVNSSPNRALQRTRPAAALSG